MRVRVCVCMGLEAAPPNQKISAVWVRVTLICTYFFRL